MTKETETAKLIQTKKALAEKYERLAKASKSRPKQKTLLRHAEHYRRQVADLAQRK